jgi:hypothetical protein
MIRLLCPRLHVTTITRRRGDRGPLARDGQKKVGEAIDELVVGQAFADRDGERAGSRLLSASLHTFRSSRRTRTLPESSRISCSTDSVRGSVDRIRLRGPSRGLGRFMGVLVFMVQAKHERE